jgi:ferredoxin-NADP reductase
VEGRAETPRARTLELDTPEWPGHRAGQHVDVRLTAEDGYQAARSYSLSGPASGGRVAITVERLDDGELSPWLVDEAQPGDFVELRGPVGGYFVWEPGHGGPLMLVGGGSGIVPLAAMVRVRDFVPTRLLWSIGTPGDAIFGEELHAAAASDHGFELVPTYTREAPPGWEGYRRRVDREMLSEVAWPAGESALAFVCGPTAFVEVAAGALAELGYPDDRIRTERFGPTGGPR